MKGNSAGAASVGGIAASLLKVWKSLVLEKKIFKETEIQCWSGTFRFRGNAQFGSDRLRFSLQNSE